MSGTTHKRPISSHPAFRWIVALYFAVLTGGGLFVMPDAVHARLRGMLGIEALVGNALTAKLVVCALAALVGLLIGLAIAARIARTGSTDAHHATDADSDAGELVEDRTAVVAESDDFLAPAVHSDEPAADPADDAVWLAEDQESDAFEEDPGVSDAGRRRLFNPRDYLTEDGFEVGPAQPEDPMAAVMVTVDPDDGPEPVDAEFEAIDGGESAAGFDGSPGDGAGGAEDAAGHVPASEGREPDAEHEYLHAREAVDAAPLRSEALGDLSLSELTGRLEQALAAQRKAQEAKPSAEASGDAADPVIAFLRREADRTAPLASQDGDEDDPQASLRSALERLARVGKRS